MGIPIPEDPTMWDAAEENYREFFAPRKLMPDP
jgi:hypothetical protein